MGRMWPDPSPAGGKLPKGKPGRKPPAPKPHHNSGSSGDCCPMVAAVRSVKRGKYHLARRYAVMSVRLLASRLG